jgi:hypothetical protein
MKKMKKLGLLAIGVLLSAEIGVRALGMVDFPLYEANAQIGYIPQANQHGSFLNKNDWEFNALHMGAAAFKPKAALDTLLVGDSLVYGGNQYRQAERLGPTLQRLIYKNAGGPQVWPISAGSWGLRNELIWLRGNSQVLDQVHRIVIILNNGDFDTASSWSCELTHPTTPPPVAIWYLFNKYVYAFEKCGDVPTGLKVPDGDLAGELKTYLAIHGAKTTFILYPDKSEATDRVLEAKNFEVGATILKTAGAASVIHVAHDSRWNSSWYKDGIHPTPEGNRVLAKIIFDNLAVH